MNFGRAVFGPDLKLASSRCSSLRSPVQVSVFFARQALDLRKISLVLRTALCLLGLIGISLAIAGAVFGALQKSS